MSAESTFSDPYEAVLADLRAKRAQIDQAIAAIEAIRIGAPIPGTAASASNSQELPAEGPGWLLGMTIPEAAKKLLTARHQTMRNAEIAEAFKTSGLAMNSADPVNTIGSVLTRRANEVGDIVKVGRGLWGLKEWYPGRSFKKEKAEAAETKAEATPPAKPSAEA
jgi:hypothetical protein